MSTGSSTDSSTEVDWTRFQVGQRVWCVNAGPIIVNGFNQGRFCHCGTEQPREGEIYTVKEIFLAGEGVLCFKLKEISRCVHTQSFWGPNVGYGATRFKPVKEQNIELFRRMCREVPVKVEFLV